MAEEGLKKWFSRNQGKGWIDCKTGKPCGRKSTKSTKRKYPKCVPLAKAKRMTAGQKASAVKRKRAVKQGVGGKPTNVPTFAKKRKSMAFGGRV